MNRDLYPPLAIPTVAASAASATRHFRDRTSVRVIIDTMKYTVKYYTIEKLG